MVKDQIRTLAWMQTQVEAGEADGSYEVHGRLFVDGGPGKAIGGRW